MISDDFCMDEYLEAANFLADCPDFWHVPPVGLWPRSLGAMGTPFIAVSNSADQGWDSAVCTLVCSYASTPSLLRFKHFPFES